MTAPALRITSTRHPRWGNPVTYGWLGSALIIVTFLALLELLNGHRVRLRQRPGINSFWLAAGEAHALGEPVAQGVLEDAG